MTRTHKPLSTKKYRQYERELEKHLETIAVPTRLDVLEELRRTA